MRDATESEVNSINDYINRISVDTGMNFYNRRGDRMDKTEIVNNLEEVIAHLREDSNKQNDIQKLRVIIAVIQSTELR